MNNIYETKLTEELIKNIGVLETMNSEDLKNHLGKTIVINENYSKQIQSIAFIDLNDTYEFADGVYSSLIDLYYDEQEYLRKDIIEKFSKGITILGIESFCEGNGTGTEIVEYLKEKYKKIFLYAGIGAETYWEYKGFESIGNYFYIYQ